MARALIAAAILSLAPTASWALDLVLFNPGDKAVQIGNARGLVAPAGGQIRFRQTAWTDELVIYFPANKCSYHYKFSAHAEGFPWRQEPDGVFKLQLGQNMELLLLAPEAAEAERPPPRQPPGFPLVPPRVQCVPK